MGKLQELIVGMKDQADTEKTARWLSEKLTEQTVKNASSSVDAASMVFAHSILDEGLSSFVEITGEVASDYWKEKIGGRKIEVAALNDQTLEQLLRTMIRKEVATIQRNESLIGKCQLLHAICKPCTGISASGDYKFEGATVSELDKLRQDIVHGDLLGQEIENVQSKLDYLRQTWNYFFVMMHNSFGLRINPAMMSASG